MSDRISLGSVVTTGRSEPASVVRALLGGVQKMKSLIVIVIPYIILNKFLIKHMKRLEKP